MEIKNKFSLRLRSNKVLSEPPLSTILGNMGIISSKFCDEINLYTKNLPSYFFFDVKIVVYTDKSLSFSINELTVYFFLKRLSKKREILLKNLDKFNLSEINVIKLDDIYYISKFKFGSYDEIYLKLIFGCISSMGLYVVKE